MSSINPQVHSDVDGAADEPQYFAVSRKIDEPKLVKEATEVKQVSKPTRILRPSPIHARSKNRVNENQARHKPRQKQSGVRVENLRKIHPQTGKGLSLRWEIPE